MTGREWLRAGVGAALVLTLPALLLPLMLAFFAFRMADISNSHERTITNRTAQSVWVIPVGYAESASPRSIPHYPSKRPAWSDTSLGEVLIPPGESRTLIPDNYVESDFGVAGLMIRTVGGEYYRLDHLRDECVIDDLSRFSRADKGLYAVASPRTDSPIFPYPVGASVLVGLLPLAAFILLVWVYRKVSRPTSPGIFSPVADR